MVERTSEKSPNIAIYWIQMGYLSIKDDGIYLSVRIINKKYSCSNDSEKRGKEGKDRDHTLFYCCVCTLYVQLFFVSIFYFQRSKAGVGVVCMGIVQV